MVVLEGFVFYFFVALIVIMEIMALIAIVAGCKRDEKIKKLQIQNKQLEISNTKLINENWRYRLKFGALDPGVKTTNGRNNM